MAQLRTDWAKQRVIKDAQEKIDKAFKDYEEQLIKVKVVAISFGLENVGLDVLREEIEIFDKKRVECQTISSALSGLRLLQKGEDNED